LSNVNTAIKVSIPTKRPPKADIRQQTDLRCEIAFAHLFVNLATFRVRVIYHALTQLHSPKAKLCIGFKDSKKPELHHRQVWKLTKVL